MSRTMADVRRHNKEAGYHFFDRDTMAFWGSKVMTPLYANNTFVTSDDNFDRTKKLYTVRRYNPESGEVDTVGEFQAFKTLTSAKDYALAQA